MARPQEPLPHTHAVTQMLADAARCGEGTRAARRPPPPGDAPAWALGAWGGLGAPGRESSREEPAWPAARGADGAVGGGAQTPPRAGREPGRWRSSPPAPTSSAGMGKQPGEGAPRTQSPPLRTRVSSLLRGSKHCIGQRVCPACSAREEDVGATHPQLGCWQKLAQHFACKLYPGKCFWKDIRLLA